MGGHSLKHHRSGDVQIHTIGYPDQLPCRNNRLLGITPDVHGVGHAVPDPDSRNTGPNRVHDPCRLHPWSEGYVDLVGAGAGVDVDEVDARSSDPYSSFPLARFGDRHL